MPKIHLDKIESQIDSRLVAEGGDLLSASDKFSGKETEKNLWLFKCEDQEIEVQTYGRRVNSYTCECSDFFKTGICVHSTAAFLEIRKRKDASKKTKKPKPEAVYVPKKMTVRVILKEVDQDELVRFIGEYARKDQQFTNALKIRFATQVDAVDLKDKYAQLFHTVIRTNRGANQSITRSGAKKIFDSIGLLLEQVQDEFRGGNYVEVFEASKNIIEKITPIFDQVSAHVNDLQSLVERAYTLIIRMLDEPISPELRMSISRFMVVCIRQYYFNYKKIGRLFLSCLLKLIIETKNRVILVQVLESETVRNFHNREIEAKLFFFYAAVAEKSNDKSMKKEVLSRIQERSWLMRNAVDVAVEFGRTDVVKLLTENAFKNSSQAKNHGRFDEFRLKIALQEESKTEVALFAAKRLLESLNFSYFELFRKNFEDESQEVPALIKKVEKLADSKDKAHCLAAIYASEKMGEKLFRLIEKTPEDLELLKKHAGLLYTFDKKRIREIVWHNIDEYLQSHIGNPSAVFVRNFIRELHKNDAGNVAKQLVRLLAEKYQSRQSLMDELFIFR